MVLTVEQVQDYCQNKFSMGLIEHTVDTITEWQDKDKFKVYANIADTIMTDMYSDVMVNRRYNFDVNNDISQRLVNNVKSVILSNKYRFTTLMNTLDLEYNPIRNYDMEENETINVSDEVNNENSQVVNYGAQTENVTETIGGETETNIHNIGTETTTLNETIGTQENTTSTNYGSQSNSSETSDSTVPFNETDYTNTNKKIETSQVGAHTDNTTQNIGEQQNSKTETKDGKTDTDTRTSKDRTNTTQTDRSVYTDTTENSTSGTSSSDTSRKLTRSGNIGVTTTQQMIRAEREVAEFNFSEVIAKLVANSITIGVWI